MSHNKSSNATWFFFSSVFVVPSLSLSPYIYLTNCIDRRWQSKPPILKPNRTELQAQDNYFVTVGLSFIIPFRSLHIYPFYFSIWFFKLAAIYALFFAVISINQNCIFLPLLNIISSVLHSGVTWSCKIYKSSSNLKAINILCFLWLLDSVNIAVVVVAAAVRFACRLHFSSFVLSSIPSRCQHFQLHCWNVAQCPFYTHFLMFLMNQEQGNMFSQCE